MQSAGLCHALLGWKTVRVDPGRMKLAPFRLHKLSLVPRSPDVRRLGRFIRHNLLLNDMAEKVKLLIVTARVLTGGIFAFRAWRLPVERQTRASGAQSEGRRDEAGRPS